MEYDTLSRKTSSFTIDRKRFQRSPAPHLPLILLDRNGRIVDVTPAARRLLECPPEQVLGPSFLSCLHPQSVPQIQRDLLAMIRCRKRQAFWLARVRTGRERWSWYKITVRNDLQRPDGVITLHLRDLQG